MQSSVVTHTFRKTAITRQADKLQTPSLDHFALHWMAIRWSYSIFQWRMFKQTYIDFNILRDRKWWQKQRQQCVEALVRPAEDYLNGAFACQRPQLYINQISRRSMQRQPRLSRDKKSRRTDGFSLYIVEDYLITHVAHSINQTVSQPCVLPFAVISSTFTLTEI